MGRKVLEMQLPGKRKRGRPTRMYLDVVKKDMQEVGTREDEVTQEYVENPLWRPTDNRKA